MTLKYRSTGQEVELKVAEPLSPERTSELRRSSPHAAALEQLASRREQEIEQSEASAHDEAVKHFDYAYKDVTSNPYLLAEVVAERQRRIEEAAEKRQVIQDWDSTYREIGESIRVKAGLKPSAERDREERLEEMQRAREFPR